MSQPIPQPPRPQPTARSGRGQRVPALTVVPVLPAHADGSPRPDDVWGRLLCAVGERQDREAFARLFAHFAPRIKHHLAQTGSPEVQAEELAQEALVAVWRKAALFDPAQAAASTWIFTIARNLRVDLLRRRQGMDAGEQAGVRMPFGCRMGICQTCVVQLMSGYTRDLRTGEEHREGDRIQTCVSAVAGSCTLDL